MAEDYPVRVELREPEMKHASLVGKPVIAIYPEGFPYLRVVDFTIVVNYIRRCNYWSSSSSDENQVKSLDFPLVLLGTTTTAEEAESGDGDGSLLIEDSTKKSSFSLSFDQVLFSGTGGEVSLLVSRLRRHVERTHIVPPEYAGLVANSLCAGVSQGMTTKPSSFLVKVQLDVVTTIEYRREGNHRGIKHKGWPCPLQLKSLPEVQICYIFHSQIGSDGLDYIVGFSTGRVHSSGWPLHHRVRECNRLADCSLPNSWVLQPNDPALIHVYSAE